MNFNLSQNYPNPFNPSTSISYTVPNQSHISLKIYNTMGQEVRELVNEIKSPGVYNVTFNASGLPSGVYFYKLKGNGISQVKKMVYLK